ncbi:MAG: EVE domain-containing protein [Pyrinomonadaceae bacterium]
MMTKYWIGVASRDHVMRGIKGGFAMLNHGKRAPLDRMNEGDYLIYYAPKEKLEDKKPLQKFVAIGKMKSGDAYQVKMSDGFEPFRKDVKFLKCEEAKIRPLIDKLDFIKDKKSWGYSLRFGHLEISSADFHLISKAMNADIGK